MPDSSKTNRIHTKLFLSVALAIGTAALTGLIDRLPFSTTRDSIPHALRWPAGLVTSLFYPEGIHTGNGGPGAIYLGVVSFVGIYWLAWFLVLECW